jgi:hypothetical protein
MPRAKAIRAGKTQQKSQGRRTLPAHLVPGNPGNSGGKPGRSGRPSDEFKAKLEGIRDTKGLPVLEEIIGGTVTYSLNGVCTYCGKTSIGPETLGDVLKLVPSVDSRLRGVDLTMRYSVGLEKTIRLEGLHGIREAFEMIKTTIRGRLAPDAASLLIDDIQTNLKTL